MTARAALLPMMCAAAVVGCGGDQDVSPETIQRALALTSSEPGGRVFTTGAWRSSSDPEGNRMRCRGTMDEQGSTDLRCGAGRDRVRVIRRGTAMYARLSPQERDRTGKRWAKVTVLNFSWEALALQYAADLEALVRVAAAGDLRKMGREELRGSPTTHYAATLDGDAVELLEPPHSTRVGLSTTAPIDGDALRVDIWIDDYRLIRRTRERFRLETYTDVVGDPPIQKLIEYTTDYPDFGPQATIEAPRLR